MNYHLYNESEWFSFFRTQFENPRLQISFSRIQDYFEYKGLNRSNESISDREQYARMYIRADNNKIEIKRHYQDFLEFYADKSLLIDFFNFLCIIFGFYNGFMADKSLRQKIFFFEKDPKPSDNKSNTDNNPSENDIVDNDGNQTMMNCNTHSNLKVFKSPFEKLNIKIKNGENVVIKKPRYFLPKCGKLKRFICFCRQYPYQYNKIDIEDPNEIIDEKLDIVYYIKSMLLLEINNEIKYGGIKSYMNYLSSIPLIKSRLKGEEGKSSCISKCIPNCISNGLTNIIEDKIDDNNETSELYKNSKQIDMNIVDIEREKAIKEMKKIHQIIMEREPEILKNINNI